jgi:ERCC4-type nuclease
MEKEPDFTIIRDTREQTPWEFHYEHTVAEEIATLKTGDYAVKGMEDKLCIERKGCIEELASNLGRDYARFARELARMDKYPHAFIICEFSMKDLIEYPYHRQNAQLQKTSKITGRYLLKVIMEIQLKYNVKIMFAGNKYFANKAALSLMKRIYERYREEIK